MNFCDASFDEFLWGLGKHISSGTIRRCRFVVQSRSLPDLCLCWPNTRWAGALEERYRVRKVDTGSSPDLWSAQARCVNSGLQCNAFVQFDR